MNICTFQKMYRMAFRKGLEAIAALVKVSRWLGYVFPQLCSISQS